MTSRARHVKKKMKRQESGVKKEAEIIKMVRKMKAEKKRMLRDSFSAYISFFSCFSLPSRTFFSSSDPNKVSPSSEGGLRLQQIPFVISLIFIFFLFFFFFLHRE